MHKVIISIDDWGKHGGITQPLDTEMTVTKPEVLAAIKEVQDSDAKYRDFKYIVKMYNKNKCFPDGISVGVKTYVGKETYGNYIFLAFQPLDITDYAFRYAVELLSKELAVGSLKLNQEKENRP